MDDLDLDDIDLENFNFDEVSKKSQQKKPQEQVRNALTNQNSDLMNNNNRPKLRKIKRPKMHTGPISSADAINSAPKSFSPATPSHPSQEAAENATNMQGGLIRASDRNAFTQEVNSFNNAPQVQTSVPNFNNNYVTDDDDFVYQGSSLPEFDTKKVIWVALACLFVGLFLGKIFFSSEQVVRNGLQGVVVNPEVPKGRARCGIAERTQGCVLYIMNPQRQELNGRDFYDLASQLTGRQRFVIETGNMRYASVKIKPGNIAQLNIPPLQ